MTVFVFQPFFETRGRRNGGVRRVQLCVSASLWLQSDRWGEGTGSSGSAQITRER